MVHLNDYENEKSNFAVLNMATAKLGLEKTSVYVLKK